MKILYTCTLIAIGIDIAHSNASTVVDGLESTTIQANCSTSYGKQVCCGAVDDTPYISRKKNLHSAKKLRTRPDNNHHCSQTRTYYPSPFEVKNFQMAAEIQNMTDIKKRTAFLSEKYKSVENFEESMKWINRVHERMNSFKDNLQETNVDWKYLSRYHVEMVCGSKIYSWNEWIEPITIHTRHPLFLRENAAKLKNVDYILLKSRYSHYNNTMSGGSSPGNSNPAKHFLFDAGSFTWDSSLFWFCCGYQQVYIRNIQFTLNIIISYLFLIKFFFFNLFIERILI